MTKAVQKVTFSPSRDIPFNKLVLSRSNVHRVKVGVSIEQLWESIAQGNLQNLNVRAVVDGEGVLDRHVRGAGRWQVLLGSRAASETKAYGENPTRSFCRADQRRAARRK